MAKQSFVTGQVLTAQQVNDLQTNDFNQTVSAKTASYTLVAADKGTRITMSSTSATTITVNDNLFAAGDTLFIQNLNTGVSTITAGTATVSTSASLALAQHEGGILYFTSAGVSTFFKAAGPAAASSGLTLITTLSPSGVASSSVDNVFSSTYDSYLIVGFLTWTDNTNLECRLRASGSDIITSSYFLDFETGQGSSGSTWYLSDNRGANIITGFTIDLTNPGNSSYKMGNLQRTMSATTGRYYAIGMRNSTLSATDGIKFFPTTGTMTGTIRIYGLAK